MFVHPRRKFLHCLYTGKKRGSDSVRWNVENVKLTWQLLVDFHVISEDVCPTPTNYVNHTFIALHNDFHVDLITYFSFLFFPLFASLTIIIIIIIDFFHI